jgi:hypothetical protein
MRKRCALFGVVALLVAGFVSYAVAASAASASNPVTFSFASGPTWATFTRDPGPTSFGGGPTALGSAHRVCLNEFSPLLCPSGATLYGFPFGAWFADLSSVPGAAWIWAPGISGSTGPAEFADYFFSKTFILAGLPTAGTISVAADDFAAVFVNRTLAGSIGSTSDIGFAFDAQNYLHSFDITGLLKPGRNVISVEGRNGSRDFSSLCGLTCTYAEDPAGVVFGGSLTFRHG